MLSWPPHTPHWESTPSTWASFRQPFLDLLADPEPGATPSKIDYRPRHIRVAPLIGADAVAVGETEDHCHLFSVDQILGVYAGSHESQSTGVDKYSEGQ